MKMMVEVDGICVHLRTEPGSVAISIRAEGQEVGDEDVWLSHQEVTGLRDMLTAAIAVATEKVE